MNDNINISSAARFWHPLVAPLRVGFVRALAETAVGACGLLLCLLLLGHPGLVDSAPFRAALALWILIWPAWRLRRLAYRTFFRRLIAGITRVILCGIVLGLIVATINAIGTHAASLPVGRAWYAYSPFGIFLFGPARLLVLIGMGLYRRARRRLRWQLALSHLAVILLTFTGITALGSLALIGIVILGLHQYPERMAASAATYVSLANAQGPLDAARTRAVLDQIDSGNLALQGQARINAFAQTTFLPMRLAVIRPDGRVLAAVVNHQWVHDSGTTSPLNGLKPAAWHALYLQALGGQARWMRIYGVAPAYHGWSVLASAPVYDAARHVSGVTLIQVPDTNPSSDQVVGFTFALFGGTTIALFSALFLPIVALSALFGYLMARTITRRLEAVSRVTTAIAAGDFSQRAPLTAYNEVGQLAANVNRMAGRLETAMAELRQARTRAEEDLRARQELIANISHELRTPLAILRAHLDTLTYGTDAQTMHLKTPGTVVVAESTLQALHNETDRLAALVDDLFALSRAQAGGLEVHCVATDVAALVADVATLMRPLALNEGQISLVVEAPPGLPLALADPDRLRQILENLVRNAVRHTPEGGIIVLSVRKEIAPGAQTIVIDVADTGEGIAPEHLPHIFERFYRVDKARTRGTGGAGLGLAIVREFVELMGGRITVESTPGEGTCFHVFLPLAPDTPLPSPAQAGPALLPETQKV